MTFREIKSCLHISSQISHHDVIHILSVILFTHKCTLASCRNTPEKFTSHFTTSNKKKSSHNKKYILPFCQILKDHVLGILKRYCVPPFSLFTALSYWQYQFLLNMLISYKIPLQRFKKSWLLFTTNNISFEFTGFLCETHLVSTYASNNIVSLQNVFYMLYEIHIIVVQIGSKTSSLCKGMTGRPKVITYCAFPSRLTFFCRGTQVHDNNFVRWGFENILHPHIYD